MVLAITSTQAVRDGVSRWQTWRAVRGNVMDSESSGVRLGFPSIRMPWSSLASESFARSAEIACGTVEQQVSGIWVAEEARRSNLRRVRNASEHHSSRTTALRGAGQCAM